MSQAQPPFPQPTPPETAAPDRKKSRWKTFGLGLGVRLIGAGLIWLGDGSPLLWRKALVVVGLILFIGGITILKYLLYSGFRKKK